MTDINAMVDAAFPAPAEAQPIADAKPEVATQEAEQGQVTDEGQEDANKPEDVPFPKKAQNALSRRDKKIGKLEQEREFLRQELAKYQQQKPEATQAKPAAKDDGRPKESDFESVFDFMEAVQDWKLEQRDKASTAKQAETQKASDYQKWESERNAYQDKKADELAKLHPDAMEVLEENADVFSAFPPKIKQVLLEADDAALALYNLAKQGKLEALASMSPARAAMEIGRAETQSPPPKPQTKAPTPLPASRGSVASGKRPEDLSGDEIRKWMKAE